MRGASQGCWAAEHRQPMWVAHRMEREIVQLFDRSVSLRVSFDNKESEEDTAGIGESEGWLVPGISPLHVGEPVPSYLVCSSSG